MRVLITEIEDHIQRILRAALNKDPLDTTGEHLAPA